MIVSSIVLVVNDVALFDVVVLVLKLALAVLLSQYRSFLGIAYS